MFNFDLKSLADLESHRGVAYVLFVAALFAPSFLALSFLSPSLAASQLTLSVIVSASVGLTMTALCTVASFTGLVADRADSEKLKRAGAIALAVGSAIALSLQASAMFVVVFGLTGEVAFRTYVQVLGFLLLVFVILLEATRKWMRWRRTGRLKELELALDRLDREIDAVEGEMDSSEADLIPLGLRLKDVGRRRTDLRAKLASMALE